jgi:hypothetical protein
VHFRSQAQALSLVEALDGSKAAAQASSDRIRPAAAELAQVTTKSQSTATPSPRALHSAADTCRGAAQGITQKQKLASKQP